MLTDATHAGAVDWYTYQPNSDWLDHVSGGIVGSRAYTNGTTLYLTADAEDRYTRFDFNTGPGQGSTVAFETYNGLGLRTFHHDVWGHDFPQAYDGASPGSALLSSAGTLFTPGLAQQDSNGQHFYQTDALGSVRGVSGNNQAPQGEVYYDAFGLPALRQGSMPWPLGFAGSAGYQTDNDTGLMLLGNRYYDPSIGRFLSPDKVHDGNNWYAYCGNAPLNHTDPTGNVYQVSPTTLTSQGQLHGQLEEFKGGIGDAGWNGDSSYDAPAFNKKLTSNQIEQLQAAVQMIGSSTIPNASQVASTLKRMISQGRIQAESLGGSTLGLTPSYPWTTASNVNIKLEAGLFDHNYDGAPQRQFSDIVELSSVMYHEYIHADKQGFLWDKFHPKEMEDQAYAAQLRYLQILRNQNKGNSNHISDINDVIGIFFGGS